MRFGPSPCNRTSCPSCAPKDTPPPTTSDGDIQFKKEGYLYYVIVKDIDDGYSYVEVRVPFGISDMSLSELQNIASELNTAKFLCKCSAYRDDSDGDNIFQIGMEFVASTSSQARYQMKHALRLMPVWISAFDEYL